MSQNGWKGRWKDWEKSESEARNWKATGNRTSVKLAVSAHVVPFKVGRMAWEFRDSYKDKTVAENRALFRNSKDFIRKVLVSWRRRNDPKKDLWL